MFKRPPLVFPPRKPGGEKAVLFIPRKPGGEKPSGCCQSVAVDGCIHSCPSRCQPVAVDSFTNKKTVTNNRWSVDKYKFIKITTTIAIIVLLQQNPSSAQVGVELEPRKITVGDPIELSLTIPVPRDASVILPDPASLAPAEVMKIDTLRIGKEELSIRYTLSIFEPGKVELTDIPIIISYKDRNDTLIINPGKITVESVIDSADSSVEIKDIHPPIKLFWTFMDQLPYMIAVVAVLVAGLVAYLIWRKIKIQRGEIVPAGPPPPPPHTIALRRLDELRIKKLWQSGYLKEYHSELTEIVKEYIGGRYRIIAPEMTTHELLERKNRWAINDMFYKQVKRILTSGDLVKFARYKADAHENEGNLNLAFDFVDATKPDAAAVVSAASSEAKSGMVS